MTSQLKQSERPRSSGVRLPPILIKDEFGNSKPRKPIRRLRGTARDLGITLIGKKRNFVLSQILRTPPTSARGETRLKRLQSPGTVNFALNVTGARESTVQFDPRALTSHLENFQSNINQVLKAPSPQPIRPSQSDSLNLKLPPVSLPENISNPNYDNKTDKISQEKEPKVSERQLLKEQAYSDLHGISKLFGEQTDTVSAEKTQKNSIENEQKMAVWKGQYSLNELPPLPKKVVRIFISSTFTDTAEERNALMQYVYPKLSDYCREQHGLEFQVVDMRWGVPEQASDNHSTTDLCIQEIKKCQEVSVGPNFVAIVGDKYGYRPIPSTIEEGVFQTLLSMKHAVNDVDWVLLERAYRKDANCLPPLYVLQRVSSLVPHYNSPDLELQQKGWKEWQNINTVLTKSLRTLAEKAFAMGKLTHAQKQLFIMSVTEREITEGVFRTERDPAESCVCIIRKIVDILNKLQDVKAPRFIDVADVGTLDEEARALLAKLREQNIALKLPKYNQLEREIAYEASGAVLSLEKFRSVDISEHAKHIQVERHRVEEHAAYLQSLCDDFFAKISSLIKEGSWKQRRLYDDITAELLQHWHLAKMRCDVFEGRHDELASAHAFVVEPHNTDIPSGPLVIYGNSGCGKTSVLAKIIEFVASGEWKYENRTKFTVLARFLGTTPNTCNLHQLLVSLCKQLVFIYNITNWNEPEKITDLIKEFHELLSRATPSFPIMLILDSIDQLMPAYNAYKIKWLPKAVPSAVKIVVSTIIEGYPIYGALQHTYKDHGGRFIEIRQLGEKLGLEIIYLWLRKEKRTMTPQQETVITGALQHCSLPLYARIAYDHISRWKSYDTPVASDLENSVRGAINKLFQTMEDKFGAAIVRHSLAYLTASRYGLSEVELEHILSLDDLLLNKVFKFWKPPVRRVPPLLWTRVRTEIHSYIVERSADDTIVLYWYHRQFIEATKARYLSETSFVKEIHRTLADFFMGKWGGGQEKPFRYTEAQVQRFRLTAPESAEDRKVPLQPYIFSSSDDAHTAGQVRPNKRKLSELPFQLVKCQDYDNLKTQTFFNYEFLYAKIIGTSPQQLLEELEMFIHSDKQLKKDIELKLLFVNLQLMKTYISQFPKSLSYELVGRLAKYMGRSAAITHLLRNCCNAGIKYCPLLPLGTCFESADLNLSQSINFRSSEPWEEGGALAFSADFKMAYVIDYDDSGVPLLRVFDVATGDKLSDVYIIKNKPDRQRDTIDVYFQMHVLEDGKHVLAVYKQKYVVGMRHVYRNYGLADIISLSTGQVTKTIEEPLRKNVHKTFNNPVIYITPNWICMKLGWKMPIYNIHSDKVVTLKKPTYLNPRNERFFILCGQKKTEMTVFETKQLISEFDVSERQLCVAANSDMSLIAMIGSETKQIRIFDLQNKHLHSSESKPTRGNMLKCSRTFDLEYKVRIAVENIYAGIMEAMEDGEAGEAIHSRPHANRGKSGWYLCHMLGRAKVAGVHAICYDGQGWHIFRIAMEFSPDGHHLMVVFQGSEEWQAYLWDAGRWNSRYVGAITPRMPVAATHPKYNNTGDCLIYAEEQKIVMFSCETGDRLNEFPIAGTIKNIAVSRLSNKVAVMLEKSVLLINISKDVLGDSGSKASRNERQTSQQKTRVLMHRRSAHEYTHREVVLNCSGDGVEINEIEDPVLSCNTDRVGTARSRKREALEVRATPDGQRVVHFHNAVQVVDTSTDTIACTPKKGDVIARQSGAVSTTLEIPGLEEDWNATPVDLLPGDKIVSDKNRVKLRVGDADKGRFKIMLVPSLITVYSAEDNKLKRMQRITVFQETIATISNHHIVTLKDTGTTEICNIYKQDSGKLLVSHQCPYQFARFSQDESLLFLVDSLLTVYVYEAPAFASIELKVSAQNSGDIGTYVIKDVVTFASDRYAILLQYREEGVGRTSRSVYRHVHCLSGKLGVPVDVSPAFEDISTDGQIAIDSDLVIYDIHQGRRLTQLPPPPAAGALARREMQLRVRLTDDKRCVVAVDKSDDTLHVIRMDDTMTRHAYICSCYTHSPNIRLAHGLEIRHFGRVITLRTEDSIKLLALCDSNLHATTEPSSFDSEVAWIQAQLDMAGQGHPPQNNARRDVSVYEQRQLILKAEKEDSGVKVEPLKKKESSKPSVLVIAGPLLAGFRAKRFTHHLDVQKVSITLSRSASWVQDAIDKLTSIRMRYDCIILHALGDDVRRLSVAKVVGFMQEAVTAALERAEAVVISLPPGRVENNPELSQKAQEVNALLHSTYSTVKNITICDNTNISDGGKLLHKYFKDQNTLSAEGLTQISVNLKEATFHALRDDPYIKAKMAQGVL